VSSGRFNPYFTGCFSFRSIMHLLIGISCWVSILILLDASLLGCSAICLKNINYLVSILILLDASLLVLYRSETTK